MQPRLKRQRALARACPQLLLDLAALLSRLRPLIMLDNAAGVTPAQLMQALQPLPQLLPQFQGEELRLIRRFVYIALHSRRVYGNILSFLGDAC
jgi:hypothetical protein